MVREKLKVDNPNLFILVSLLLFLSIGLLLYGYAKNGVSENKGDMIVEEKTPKDDVEEPLLQYFENVNLSSGEGESDDFYFQTDPFKETCAQTSGDGKVSISFGTVCYR